MDKPINLIIEDTKQGLADILNNSKLPAFVLDNITKDLANEVHSLYVRELAMDKQKWEAEQKKASEEKEEDDN